MPAPPLPRRTLLKRGLLGGALLSAGTLAWTAGRGVQLGPEPRRPLRVLTRQEYAVAGSIAACLIPAREGWPSSWDVECAEKFDELLVRLHPETVTELRQLLHLFENGLSGLLTTLSPTPFSHLDVTAQAARLEAWRQSKLSLLRSGYLALTRLFHATYYASPRTYALVGYPGPPEVPMLEDVAP